MGYIAASAAMLTAQIVQGVNQDRNARKSQGLQARAQARTESAAASQLADDEAAMRKENRKTADMSRLLGEDQASSGTGGLGGSLLSGVAGVDPQALNLGRTTILGG